MKEVQAFVEKKRWSQAEFGRRVKVHRSVVSRWFNGGRKPTMDQMKRISDVTGIGILRLLEDV